MVFMGKIVFIIISLFSISTANAQKDQTLVAKGNELYKKQAYKQAAEQYKKATDVNAKNGKAQYNLGDALYKAEKPENAEKAFEAAASNIKDETSRSKALYNKGVALSSQKKLLESINAYKESLRLNSTDEQARENLQRAINELKKQSQQQDQQKNQKQDNKKQNKQQNQQEPEQQKNNSKLNQKQVEQLLSSLRKDEKKIQQDLQKKNNIGKSNSKDW